MTTSNAAAPNNNAEQVATEEAASNEMEADPGPEEPEPDGQING
jgi:hypothetical protein